MQPIASHQNTLASLQLGIIQAPWLLHHNILFVMADDHAAKAISCYGADINHTPNLDRLAAEGMLFNHCYVTNSICTPSRAAILTGTHNHVNGVYTLSSKINNRIPNVAKHLRTAGYQTAMIGMSTVFPLPSRGWQNNRG